MIPPATPEAIEEAMRRFDKELRDSSDWKNWEKNETFKHAIEANGRRYPVKQIIAIATGASRRTFSGGPEANSYVTSRGFSVIPIRDKENILRNGLEKVLNKYLEVRQSKPFGQDQELRPAFESVCDTIRKLPGVASRPTLKVVWSVGRGNWARIPWISILDQRETESTQQGVYCVFLFRADLSGVYLTFNQGVTEPQKRLGPGEGLEEVKQKATKLRGICGPLKEAGYQLDDHIDLRVEGGLGRDYEFSTIAYKLYEKGRVPVDEDIAEDLDSLLAIYEQYVSKGSPPVTPLHAKPAVSQDAQSQEMRDPLGELRDSLERQGLHFSVELIANYLLALRAKRFVILCGLSGTGKTKLAITIAQHFEARVESPEIIEIPEGAVVVEAQPYMFEHNQITVPKALLAQMRLAPAREGTKGGGHLNVSYPQGREVLSFWRDPDLSNNSLFLKGPFREWFKATVKSGDSLLFRAISEDPDKPDDLEISIPKTEERSKLLANRCVVAVRPNWTDSREMLGYFNPLTKRYVVQPVLKLLLRARDEMEAASREDRLPYPFFVILDEMNLAHVEQYFSDFLSCLESGEALNLHEQPEIESGANEGEIAVPTTLQIPQNVFFTGTVNVDETTYMFSPKVLDRAFTIELHNVDLEKFGHPKEHFDSAPGVLRLTTLPTLGAHRNPDITDWVAFEKLIDGEPRNLIVSLNDLLSTYVLHFGYRVANEIACFVSLAARHTDGSASNVRASLDLAILEKVLPKFHGTQEELDDPLRALFTFACSGSPVATSLSWEDIQDGWRFQKDRLEPTKSGLGELRLPRTAAKIWLMLRRLHQQGFTAFIG
jgi:5-methylcytosine-specific restriction enzyme MrcB-like protein